MSNAKEPNEIVKLGLQKREGKTNMTWDEIDKMFGLKPDTARQMTKRYCKSVGLLKGKYQMGRKRILVMGDLHIPDQQTDLILDIVEKNKDVHMIILNGDILDCQAVSGWHDEQMTILDYELKTAYQLLAKIRKITKAKIVLVKGNHEQRVNKHYAQNAKSMGTAVVETEILYKLAYGFQIKLRSGVRVTFDPIENVEYADGRSYAYGDLVVNHPSSYSKLYMQTATRMWEGKLKDKYKNAKVIICGHTHQLGVSFVENGVVLVEGGCLCKPARYADNDDRPYRVQQYGYIYLEMQDGKVDIDSIKAHYLGNDNEYKNSQPKAIDDDFYDFEFLDDYF